MKKSIVLISIMVLICGVGGISYLIGKTTTTKSQTANNESTSTINQNSAWGWNPEFSSTTNQSQTSNTTKQGISVTITPIKNNNNNALAIQSQCANQAQEALSNFESEMTGQGYTNYSQENNYDSALNKCFVLISYNPVPLPAGTDMTPEEAYSDPTNIETLEDAYANTDLADCTYYGNRDTYGTIDLSNPDTYTICLIGNDKVSYQQYKDFVSERLNLSE